jgi:hypothetical protein
LADAIIPDTATNIEEMTMKRQTRTGSETAESEILALAHQRRRVTDTMSS